MVTELRICPQCQAPYDRHPKRHFGRCPRCAGLAGAAVTARQHTYDRELAVLEAMAETLDSLDRAARGRALTWLLARYGDAL